MWLCVLGDGGLLDHGVPTVTSHRPVTRCAFSPSGCPGHQNCLQELHEGDLSC